MHRGNAQQKSTLMRAVILLVVIVVFGTIQYVSQMFDTQPPLNAQGLPTTTALTTPNNTPLLEATVISVHDGDTIWVRPVKETSREGRHNSERNSGRGDERNRERNSERSDERNRDIKVRLIGIDTPELTTPRKTLGTNTQDTQKAAHNNGQLAKKYAQELIAKKQVWLEFDTETHDHFGRTLAYVWDSNPETVAYNPAHLINFRLVYDGYAEQLPVSPNTSRQSLFAWAENQAQEDRHGLWEYGDFRKFKK